MCTVCCADLAVSFDAEEYETSEGVKANITLVANTSSYASPFDVLLMFMEQGVIAASEGVDYISSPDRVSFVAGQERLSFQVDIPDDQVAELLESFKIKIVGYSSCLEGLVNGGTTTTFVQIQDDDSECRLNVCGHEWMWEIHHFCIRSSCLLFVFLVFVICHCLELVVSMMPTLYPVSEGDSVEVTFVTNIPYVFQFNIVVNTYSVTAIGMATHRHLV